MALGLAQPLAHALLPLVLTAGALAGIDANPTPEIRFVRAAEQTLVELRGLGPELIAELGTQRRAAADWAELLALYTEEASLPEADLPPLLGSWKLESWGVRFTPRFALAAGKTYVARFIDPASGRQIRATHSVAAVDTPPSTTLTGIYPSVPEVPENLLRLYLQFSGPMSRGNARHHIRLLDRAGDPVEGPFVAPERELWSPDGTRLTLFFDPGRIKRSVGPNAEVGPPLEIGGRYRLEIDHELADARGVPLVRDYFKEYEVRGPDRDQPRVDGWTLEPPAAPSEPVRLTFPEPLDRGLLEGVVGVLDGGGEEVAGRVAVGHGETEWSFVPKAGWRSGVYRIRVATLLEDLAGNSLRRPFETALDGGSGHGDDGPPYVDLPFSVQ